MKSKSILLLLGHFSPYDSEATQFNRVPIIIIEVPASFTNFQTDREHKRLPALTVARGEHVARASSPLLPGAWLQGSRKISKYPRICAVIEESSPALNKPRQAQAEPASGSSSCAHHPAPGRGTQLSSPRPPKSARPRRVGRWRPGHLKRERARWRKARRGGRCQPAPASGRGRCRRRGHVEGGGARCPRPRRGALEGDRASSAVGPVRPPRGPGRASRCPRPGLRGHRHPPGAPRPCSAGPKPGRAGGACEKANRNRGALAAMPSPRGLSPGRGKKAPTSRPGRGQRRCPGSGPVVADTASRESSEVPRGPGFKETGNSFQCREPAPRRSQRPPARGPAPTHRAPKFRRCGPLGGLGPARRSGPRPPGRSRLGRGAGRRLPAPAFQGPGNENADVRPQHGVAGRSPAARKVRASHFSRFPRRLAPGQGRLRGWCGRTCRGGSKDSPSPLGCGEGDPQPLPRSQPS